jgi:DNA adenine methylase
MIEAVSPTIAKPMIAAAAVKFRTMILRRIGNKSKMANDIQRYFPQHSIYVEPFFGAGGMFFNKPKAKYNIVNDLDSDVFNLFQVVTNKKDELIEAFKQMPIHQDLMDYWNKNKETDEIRKALRFLLLSNYGYMGKPETIGMQITLPSQQILKNIDKTFELLFNVKFSNKDFRKFLKVIAFRNDNEVNATFIYADSPYLNTVDTYSDSDVWTEKDVIDLFEALTETKCKWAMSEFNHPFVIEQANKRGLEVIVIGERQNLKNRRTEILVTNYKKPLSLFDGV